MSKKISTLILLAALYCGNAFAQCTSPATSYDLIVVSNITIPAQSNSNYMQGYVCNGGVLLDSAYCCTRFVNVDSGGVMMVGPSSYGQAFVKNGGTFNGQGSSANWAVFYEAGANVINHVGNSQQCPQITFTNNNCIMGFTENESPKPTVALNGDALNFGFDAVMTDVRIELLDVNGKVVKSEMMNQSSVHSMDVSGLASGVYMYRVMRGAELISSDKLVISE